jgi:hypothetical protein
MAKFEIWNREKLGGHQGLPEDAFYTLGRAMDEAKSKSKGTKSTSVWQTDPKDPWGSGKPLQVDIPKMFAVIERSDKASVIRGYGINGKWHDARDCKRCNNSGQNQKSWQEFCPSCNGASFKPKV